MPRCDRRARPSAKAHGSPLFLAGGTTIASRATARREPGTVIVSADVPDAGSVVGCPANRFRVRGSVGKPFHPEPRTSDPFHRSAQGSTRQSRHGPREPVREFAWAGRTDPQPPVIGQIDTAAASARLPPWDRATLTGALPARRPTGRAVRVSPPATRDAKIPSAPVRTTPPMRVAALLFHEASKPKCGRRTRKDSGSDPPCSAPR